MQGATENCNYPELVEKPMRSEIIFTYTMQHVTELFALGGRMSLVAVDNVDVN